MSSCRLQQKWKGHDMNSLTFNYHLLKLRIIKEDFSQFRYENSEAAHNFHTTKRKKKGKNWELFVIFQCTIERLYKLVAQSKYVFLSLSYPFRPLLDFKLSFSFLEIIFVWIKIMFIVYFFLFLYKVIYHYNVFVKNKFLFYKNEKVKCIQDFEHNKVNVKSIEK